MRLARKMDLARVAEVRVTLYGSLAATGEGHGTPMAIVLGLLGERPESVDPKSDGVRSRLADVWNNNCLLLCGKYPVKFGKPNFTWARNVTLPLHSNGMTFTAYDARGIALDEDIFYSIGGGFFVDREGLETDNALAVPGAPGVSLQGECLRQCLFVDRQRQTD
jgi:L-serine dehydratase